MRPKFASALVQRYMQSISQDNSDSDESPKQARGPSRGTHTRLTSQTAPGSSDSLPRASPLSPRNGRARSYSAVQTQHQKLPNNLSSPESSSPEFSQPPRLSSTSAASRRSSHLAEAQSHRASTSASTISHVQRSSGHSSPPASKRQSSVDLHAAEVVQQFYPRLSLSLDAAGQTHAAGGEGGRRGGGQSPSKLGHAPKTYRVSTSAASELQAVPSLSVQSRPSAAQQLQLHTLPPGWESAPVNKQEHGPLHQQQKQQILQQQREEQQQRLQHRALQQLQEQQQQQQQQQQQKQQQQRGRAPSLQASALEHLRKLSNNGTAAPRGGHTSSGAYAMGSSEAKAHRQSEIQQHHQQQQAMTLHSQQHQQPHQQQQHIRRPAVSAIAGSTGLKSMAATSYAGFKSPSPPRTRDHWEGLPSPGSPNMPPPDLAMVQQAAGITSRAAAAAGGGGGGGRGKGEGSKQRGGSSGGNSNSSHSSSDDSWLRTVPGYGDGSKRKGKKGKAATVSAAARDAGGSGSGDLESGLQQQQQQQLREESTWGAGSFKGWSRNGEGRNGEGSEDGSGVWGGRGAAAAEGAGRASQHPQTTAGGGAEGGKTGACAGDVLRAGGRERRSSLLGSAAAAGGGEEPAAVAAAVMRQRLLSGVGEGVGEGREEGRGRKRAASSAAAAVAAAVAAVLVQGGGDDGEEEDEGDRLWNEVQQRAR